MKKKEVNEIEKEIEEKTNLADEVKNKIIKIIFENFLLCIAIVSYLLCYLVGTDLVKKELLILISKISSLITLFLSIILIEIAYKKDSGYITMNALEILTLAIITLFIPYTFLKKSVGECNYNKTIGAFFIIYYLIKAVYIYNYEKKKIIKQKSDIKEIVEKSDKNLLKEEKEKRQKEAQKIKKAKNKIETEMKTTRQKKEKTKIKTDNEKTKLQTKQKQSQDKSEIKQDKSPDKIETKQTKDPNKVETNQNEKEKKETKKKNPSNAETKEAPKKRGRPRKEKIEQ